jgi:hypothetical protein
VLGLPPAEPVPTLNCIVAALALMAYIRSPDAEPLFQLDFGVVVEENSVR